MSNPFNNEHIQLLINAFQKDPMFVKLFNGPTKNRQMEAFFKFIYKRNQLKHGIYLTDAKDHPNFVAFIETPNVRRYSLFNRVRLNLEMLKLAFYIPIKSLNFLSRYDATTIKQRPRDKHYYLTMIGVSPEKQGQGIGEMVINNIHKMVIDNPESSIICLDTENFRNVSYYERVGYSLIHEVKISNVSIYCMKKLNL